MIARIKNFSQRRTISSKQLGRYFELLTVQTLQNYRFDVWLCGGPKDRGIDFRGVWNLSPCRVHTLGQCKCYKTRLGPVHVRELEGTLSHERTDTLGLLVTSTGFTKDAYQHFMGSTYPLGLTVIRAHQHHIDAFDSCVGQIQETTENKTFEELVPKSSPDTLSEEMFTLGSLSVFELNITARCLVPGVVVAKTLSKREGGSPVLLLRENEFFTEIKY